MNPKSLMKTNYTVSMLAFGSVALFSLADVGAQYQNVGLAFGLITGISALVAGQQITFKGDGA